MVATVRKGIKAIERFSGQYDFLSNFHSSPVLYDGVQYPTAEHAYQAAKTTDHNRRLYIAGLSTPGQAKRAGQFVILREQWDEIKLGVMLKILREKFKDPKLRKALITTGDVMLVEGNYWGDIYWGVCDGKGANHLGKLLMQVREEVQNGK